MTIVGCILLSCYCGDLTVEIAVIDNPLGFDHLEDNFSYFVSKFMPTKRHF